MAAQLKKRGHSLQDHWTNFTTVLTESGLGDRDDYAPFGYSYYLRTA